MEDMGSDEENAKAFLHIIDESSQPRPDAIISGGADGADAAAEALALVLGVPAVVMHVGDPSSATQSRADTAEAPWALIRAGQWSGGPGPDGKQTYLARNCAMAELCSAIGGWAVGAHDSESSGTEHMFDSCESHGVPSLRWTFTKG